MSTRAPRIEFAVGAFLLLALASLLVLALASTNGRFGFGGDTYEVTARFTNLGPLRPNAPVKVGGVAIGKVADIGLDPVKLDSVVTLAIDSRYDDLPADTSAAILTSGLLGESYIGLAPGGDPDPLKDGDEIFLTQSSVDIIQMVGKYMFSGGAAGAGNDAATGEGNATPADAGDDDVPDYLK
ncbi:outer membrane lipid asymmetry maintenance protein MlaD [Lysobacter sp. SG-8]|uniref:Outer membrane lipid asymmetry maintenance protein MlaD n=1 Tax=Marilutibacter penaei TaxID=2759900 RepID=A0A7W3U463_9GAMM|nr:outer membrane lipid asymmetry maintenance protein MlaD [Lysobacter penaei]MBB1088632.1 outer membrane lipid asymmetry maintenance protein MlaD [Lysobacter penaei]